jgi:AGZA family xanthine/uracil permease-like MFS transporter
VSQSLGQLALHLPIPGGEVLHGLRDIAPLLATAVPLGVYNFAEGMSNVESAAAAGDRYPVRQVLTADGIGAIVGSFLGSPFPPAVYIGHPGWKQVGGRIGYSLVTGIVVAVVCFTGLVGTFLAIFPMQALVPVLLYIGLVIGSQANTTSARRYAPAIVLAVLPSLAQWATGQIDNALAAAGTTAATVVTDLLFVNGTLMRGLGCTATWRAPSCSRRRGPRPPTACTPSATCTPGCTGRTTAGRASRASSTPSRSRRCCGSSRASRPGCTAGRSS